MTRENKSHTGRINEAEVARVEECGGLEGQRVGRNKRVCIVDTGDGRNGLDTPWIRCGEDGSGDETDNKQSTKQQQQQQTHRREAETKFADEGEEDEKGGR
jgi:hypothetical protein